MGDFMKVAKSVNLELDDLIKLEKLFQRANE